MEWFAKYESEVQEEGVKGVGRFAVAHDYFAPGRGAKYCDEYVCLSVCLSACITRKLFLLPQVGE